jgi:hypothetical protein
MPRGVSGDKSRAENLREEELQLACGLLEGIACDPCIIVVCF